MLQAEEQRLAEADSVITTQNPPQRTGLQLSSKVQKSGMVVWKIFGSERVKRRKLVNRELRNL